jgi:hypothetical protein
MAWQEAVISAVLSSIFLDDADVLARDEPGSRIHDICMKAGRDRSPLGGLR